jgi:5-formyltetrahydrofolate cyclo-ligase
VVAFDDKQTAREWAWSTLDEEGQARFPFPPQGRIPNFAGAPQTAQRLVDHPLLADADRVKVNPDSPQRFVREALLHRGTVVFVPTPRLKGGFKRLDPTAIPSDEIEDAAKLSKMDAYAEPVDLDELPAMDAIVAGSVAVTRDGRRAGKGEGYSDLEYAILRELGHPETPVATTVHPIQLVDRIPREDTDVPLNLICTPDETVAVEDPPPAPEEIDWAKLGDKRVEEMPVLAELRKGSEKR